MPKKTEAGRRLTIGDALGLTKLPKLRKPHGQTRGLKHFAPGGLCAPKPFDPLSGPEGEPVNVMSFGEQFVELLGEFVDAREHYAYTRRLIGSDANSDGMEKAGNALQALLEKRFPQQNRSTSQALTR